VEKTTTEKRSPSGRVLTIYSISTLNNSKISPTMENSRETAAMREKERRDRQIGNVRLVY